MVSQTWTRKLTAEVALAILVDLEKSLEDWRPKNLNLAKYPWGPASWAPRGGLDSFGFFWAANQPSFSQNQQG